MVPRNSARDLILNGKSILGLHFDINDCLLVDGFNFTQDYISIGELDVHLP